MTTMLDARGAYYQANQFAPDGGDSEPWVDFKLGPVPMPFPNSDARRKAVRYHDLHHVLTGYRTDIIGELEISGWELGAGCGSYLAAWVLNLGGLVAGLIAAPGKTIAAFVRGRRTKTLYSQPFEPLLGRDVEAVRAEVGLASYQPGRVTAGDVLWLTGAVMLALAVWLPVVALTPVIFVPWFVMGRRYLRSLG